MKKIEAIIQPFRLEAVKEALHAISVEGMTVTEVKGFGRAKRPPGGLPGHGVPGGFPPQGEDRDRGRGRQGGPDRGHHRQEARTGRIGDGKIFVYPVAEVIRIRTGEKGDEAV